MTSLVSGNQKPMAARNARHKGRIKNLEGMYLHLNCRDWVKHDTYSWFGTKDQAQNLIDLYDIEDAEWVWENELINGFEKMNPKSNRPGLYEKG